MRERTKIIVGIGSMVTMAKLLAVILLPGVLVIILTLANTANAIPAGDLQDFEVIGHHFTTSITTRHGERSRTEVVLDPSESRWIILKLSVTVPEDNAKIFLQDFRPAYFHRDGKEDRGECKAIAVCKTREPGDFDIFRSGNEIVMTVKYQAKIYFGLAAVIDSDVETINIYRTGAKEPLSYYIGSKRLYSVYISTNIDDPEMLTVVKEIIKAGGYSVHVSTELPADEIGTTIYYAEKAETQAREISQRLMIKLRAIPKVQELNLYGTYDITVWLGRQAERI